jgi:hypothetical protein
VTVAEFWILDCRFWIESKIRNRKSKIGGRAGFGVGRPACEGGEESGGGRNGSGSPLLSKPQTGADFGELSRVAVCLPRDFGELSRVV